MTKPVSRQSLKQFVHDAIANACENGHALQMTEAPVEEVANDLANCTDVLAEFDLEDPSPLIPHIMSWRAERA